MSEEASLSLRESRSVSGRSMQRLWPCCLVMGAGTGAREAPGGLCSPRSPTSLLLERTQWAQKNLAGREKPGRRAKLAAMGQGQGAAGTRGLRTCIYRGQVGPMQSSSHRLSRWKVREDAEGQSLASQLGGMYSALSHTRASHVRAHPLTQVHSHAAHTYTHVHSRTQCTHIRPTCAPTHAHIHVGLTSGSWLRSWRSEPPGCTSPWSLCPDPT